MMLKHASILTALVVWGLGKAPLVHAVSLESRVARLESLLKNPALTMDMAARIEVLQAEVQALRGKVEEQEHFIATFQAKSVSPEASESLAQMPSKTLEPLRLETNSQTLAIHEEAVESPPNKNTKLLYDSAFEFVNTNQPLRAKQALTGFLDNFPDAQEAPDAHYWLGEINFLLWQKNKQDDALKLAAEHEFKYLTLYFGDHQRAPQAMLKLGLLAEMTQDWPRVQFYLNNLMQQYPKASSTRIAKAKLERLSQEGRF